MKKQKRRNCKYWVYSCSKTDVNDFKRWPAASREFAEKMLEKVNFKHTDRDNAIEEAQYN